MIILIRIIVISFFLGFSLSILAQSTTTTTTISTTYYCPTVGNFKADTSGDYYATDAFNGSSIQCPVNATTTPCYTEGATKTAPANFDDAEVSSSTAFALVCNYYTGSSITNSGLWIPVKITLPQNNNCSFSGTKTTDAPGTCSSSPTGCILTCTPSTTSSSTAS